MTAWIVAWVSVPVCSILISSINPFRLVNQCRGDLISGPVRGGRSLADGDLGDVVVRPYRDRRICENLGECNGLRDSIKAA